MGYHDSIVMPPNMLPSAVASFPSIRNSSGSSSLASMQYGSSFSKLSLKYSLPMFAALTFNSIADCLPLNCLATAFSRISWSRPSISAKTPT